MKFLMSFLTLLVLSIISNGDTITLTNNASLNGKIIYTNGYFEVSSEYKSPDGKKYTETHRIHRTRVYKIEFNTTTFNPGDPPIWARELDQQIWPKGTTPFRERKTHMGTKEAFAYNKVFSPSIDTQKIDDATLTAINRFLIAMESDNSNSSIDNLSDFLAQIKKDPALKDKVMESLHKVTDTVNLLDRSKKEGVLIQIDDNRIQILENETQVDLNPRKVKSVLIGK